MIARGGYSYHYEGRVLLTLRGEGTLMNTKGYSNNYEGRVLL